MTSVPRPSHDNTVVYDTIVSMWKGGGGHIIGTLEAGVSKLQPLDKMTIMYSMDIGLYI